HNTYSLSESNLSQLKQKKSFQIIEQIATDRFKFLDHRTYQSLGQILKVIELQSKSEDTRKIAQRIGKTENNQNPSYPSFSRLLDEYWLIRNNKLSMFKRNLIPIENFEIIDILESPEENIKRTVVFLLLMLEAIEPLIQVLKHNDTKFRIEAAWALGEIKDHRAAKPLIQALQDSDKELRETARQALLKIISKYPEVENIIPF
ncbi:MAG: HEAT repeat domain-containing protein, partial [Oscillatoria sp. PMC 1068.18]|nr:HEAT repeat domain-containing protein [Oscillatoria sp. PMC 1068.18]